MKDPWSEEPKAFITCISKEQGHALSRGISYDVFLPIGDE